MGEFNDKIEAEFDPPRKWVLSRALTYRNWHIDVKALEKIGVECPAHRITCKKDFVTDLASVPRVCWHLLHLGMLLVLQLFMIFCINVFVNIVLNVLKV